MANLGYLQVTRKCNQNCLFCSNPENPNQLTIDDAKTAITQLKEQGFDGVILTGGEPTLYEFLEPLIAFCDSVKVLPRMISNGKKLADYDFFSSLVTAGLRHVHLSLHSCLPKVQDYLSQTENSLVSIMAALDNASRLGVSVNINTVINAHNADHLDKTVKWIVRKYPFITHFVWNNLDPHMNRVAEHPEVVPSFQQFEISLHRALSFLESTGRTFRVERVPLCFMAEFAHCSTETRKIVKSEKREIYFLDERKRHSQDNFFYEKGSACEHCSVNRICAGVYGGDQYFSLQEIFSIFSDVKKIEELILSSEPSG